MRHNYSTIGSNPRVFINRSAAGSDFYYYSPVVNESTDVPTAVDTNQIIYPLSLTDNSQWESTGRVVSV